MAEPVNFRPVFNFFAAPIRNVLTLLEEMAEVAVVTGVAEVAEVKVEVDAVDSSYVNTLDESICKHLIT